jgi:phosphoglycolate phosphatase
MTQQTYAFDGVLALIDEICQSQFRWGVVTNKSRRFTEPLTQGMPLFSTASVVISGDTTPYAKPHPEPLFEAARRLGVDPAQCVYVGDDERDIVAGLAAGMLTVAATYGYLGTKSDVNAWGAHAQINSPLDLLQLLVST